MFGVLTELRRYAADVPPTAVGACCGRLPVPPSGVDLAMQPNAAGTLPTTH